MNGVFYEPIPDAHREFLRAFFDGCRPRACDEDGHFIASAHGASLDIVNIIAVTAHLLRSRGLEVVDDIVFDDEHGGDEAADVDKNVLIKTHVYRKNDPTAVLHSKFCSHKDDFGDIPSAVNTIIYYVRKDATLRGGDLWLIDHDTVFDVRKDMMVLMRGDCVYGVTHMIGVGEAHCITVQIQRPT